MLTVLDYFSKSNFVHPYMDIHNFWNCLSDKNLPSFLKIQNSWEILQRELRGKIIDRDLEYDLEIFLQISYNRE